MRAIERRRHTMRVKPGDTFPKRASTSRGAFGETMEPYELVVTSPVARAFETAIAMGFAVDEQ